MAGISSLGIGSGVLNSDLVDQLVAAERKPTENRLNFNQQRAEALISAYGTLRSAITELRLPMRQLSSAENLKAFSGSSSNDAVAISVDSKAASQGSYTVTVDSLAQAQSLASGTFSDRDSTPVGSGSLTISVGDKTATINIDSSNNTLQGIAAAINDAGVGASAGVIDTGNGYRLVLSSENTGVDNAINISVADDDGVNTDVAGLSQLAFDGTTNNLTETVAAKNAIVQINGIEISRATNTIDNAIDGVSLTVTEAGATSLVKVSRDLGKVADRVGAFVEKFNALQQTIKGLSGFNAETGEGSLLSGDSTIRGIQNQLRQIIGRVVPGLENASVRTLSDAGITTDSENGGLEFDRDKFLKQLEANPDDITALFAEQGRTTDDQIEFVRSGVNTTPGSYDINITQAATQGLLAGANVGSGPFTIDAGNDELTFRVDGAVSVSIQLTAGTYTQDQLAAEIQAQLNSNSALSASGKSVNVGVNAQSGALEFRSETYGSESNVSLTAVDTNSSATLGLSVASGTAGVDVQGTINGQRATGDGQLLSVEGTAGAAGMVVKVTGDATGNRGSVNFIEGVADRTVDLITSFLGQDGVLEARTEGLQKELGRIEEERIRLDERISSYRARLVSQFTAADSLIAQLNNTRDYVTQQLAALAPQNNRNNN
ncbi:flagellar filament capping protein FliD [Marinobacter hydrocarbonoclasticus]|uniref:flagellar filament capping protein FliD n=1 Tax=Marinobacter nauticus TaxID=2743 RepID=UPI001C979773|nr:flagellar filament capping protein FliD [Marinobacter nauticus]MBY6192932.1 flagellar filament capping protein FliD [Marinobacter nauticus]MBY6214080.1 flagellar filament capping protein FliD [Marinobacter nauticus]